MEMQNALYQWVNGALCWNNASVCYFQNMFLAFGVSPQTSAGVPFLAPYSATPTFPSTPQWEYPAGAQAYSEYSFILI